MVVEINGNQFVYPTNLHEDTLGQRIRWEREQAPEFAEIFKSCLSITDPFQREAELTQATFERAFALFSFYTNIDVAVLKSSIFGDSIAGIAMEGENRCVEEMETLRLQLKHEWNGETWEIHPPELHQGSTLTFGEFIDSKVKTKSMIDANANKWEALLPLCAIFFRRYNEPYQEEFMYPGSERQTLMETLPLDIALQVGFFLNSCRSFVMPHSLFSRKTNNQKQVVNFLLRTLSGGGGLISSKKLQRIKCSMFLEAVGIPFKLPGKQKPLMY